MRIARLPRGFGPWYDIWHRSGWRVQLHCIGGQARVLDPASRTTLEADEGTCLAEAVRRTPSARRRRGVVVLHGILNDPAIMRPLARAVDGAGWSVANFGYPSTRRTLAAHAEAASRVARALAEDGAEAVDFVGHSLGGLVAGLAVARAAQDGWQAGQLVLIGTPLRGSSVARAFRGMPGYATFLGPCGTALAQHGVTVFPSAEQPRTAVIAGGTGSSTGFNPLLRSDNDFTVTVKETRIPEAEAGFLLVRAMHNPLVAHRNTIQATLRFLHGGPLAS